MRHTYLTRSRFFQPVEDALRSLPDGPVEPVHIRLGPGGYERDVHIVIRPDEPDTSESDWRGTDPKRLSARIRAAAPGLLRLGFIGRYHVSHRDGTLSISPA